MKWNLFGLALILAGLLTACGNNTCQPGYYNQNCSYPAGYYPGGQYPYNNGATGYPAPGYQGYQTNPYATPYGNPYVRPY